MTIPHAKRTRTKKARSLSPWPCSFVGRGDRIRTCDILLPKQARYQAAPLPDARRKYTALSTPSSGIVPATFVMCRGTSGPMAHPLRELGPLALANLQRRMGKLRSRQVIRALLDGFAVNLYGTLIDHATTFTA